VTRVAIGGRERRIGPTEAIALALVIGAGLIVPLLLLGGGSRALPAVLEPEPAYAAADAPCGGEPMPEPDRVITGSFGRERQGSYVMLPFHVPRGTDAIRVKYCHDQPSLNAVPGVSTLNSHTLDMGLYGPRSGPRDLWDEDEFRGWGGSSRKDVTLSPEGSIDPDPAPVATEETTVGYHPGRIKRGRWAVELGVAAVGIELPGEDGEVAYRVEIDLVDDPSFADDPYERVRYRRRPANRNPGWYAGDFHVHARNSNPADATMRAAFDYAFAPLGEGAGLDFITLSDYVSARSPGEIGAFQRDYPGKLIIRSAEVITYRGHINNHGSPTFVDYRTGPIYKRTAEGSLVELRGPRPAHRIFADIHAAGGWTQINHPQIFPSDVPTLGNFCRGCSWEYSDAETDYSQVDAFEVATGPAGLRIPTSPGPNPFTVLALLHYERAIDAGGRNANHIAAVGSSDSHKAGSPPDGLTAPIGQATTVVRANRLSERGIARGIRAGHTYVKVWGNDGADLRLEATPTGGGPTAIMGDTLSATSADFTAQVLNLRRSMAARPGAYVLFVYRDGDLYSTRAIVGNEDAFTWHFRAPTAGRYRLQLMRLVSGVASIEAVSSPIYLQPGHPDALGD
jgi:hypothetical protein